MNILKSLFEAWKKSLRYADPKFMDLLIEYHNKAEAFIEILQKENKALKDAITDEEMNHFQTQLKLRGAEQDLADKDQEIHRLRIREADREADIKHLQKQLQDHIVDTNKKVEEPSVEDKWAGFVPRVTGDGYGCHLLCPSREHRYNPEMYRCHIYNKKMGNGYNDRLPECIAEYGLNPDEVNS